MQNIGRFITNQGNLGIYPFPGPIPSTAPLVPHATSTYALAVLVIINEK